MATTRTVANLILDVRDRSDTADMLVRHPDATIMAYLTQSLRALRNLVTGGGFSGLLDWTTPAALPVAPPIAGENFLEVAWPADAVEILGVDVNMGPTTLGLWYPLDTMTVSQRRDWNGQQGRPEAFLIRSVPRESTPPSTVLDATAGQIQIYPNSTLGLSYRILFLPAFPELTATTSVIQGFDGDWIEWVIWDAAIKVLFKDDEMDPSQDQKAVRERAMVQERIVTSINRIQRAGPIQPTRAGWSGMRRSLRRG